MTVRAVLAVIVGALTLLWPRSLAMKAKRQHDARLAELRSGATEKYFEERRALEAYHPPRRELAWRLLGAALLAAGLSTLVFD